MTRRRLNSVASEMLVLRCQGGDAKALTILYEYWRPRLAGHARRLTGRPDAVADVCQDSWLAIARGISRLDDPARFPAWAYRIVTRRCADFIRERTRRAGHESLTDNVIESPQNPCAELDEIELLRAAMRRLPTDHHVVLALYYGDDLSVRDIAMALDIPAGTVKSRLHNARQALALALERKEP